jgi:outer membrane protein OmpA-like peptidoglycan-associated protein
MILRHQRILIISIAAFLVWFLVSGCATKSFVMKRTQEVEDKTIANQDRIEQLDRKVSDTDAKAEEALSTARKALKKAEEAAGYVNYGVIGERDVNFDFDKYDLTLAAKDILDEIGATMQGNRALILEIEGHTDNIASDAYNLALGQKRAQSVIRYLADKFGIAIYRMFYISHGEYKPKALNDSRTGRATNRRAVLRVLGPPSE